jgi:hypothetical protein
MRPWVQIPHGPPFSRGASTRPRETLLRGGLSESAVLAVVRPRNPGGATRRTWAPDKATMRTLRVHRMEPPVAGWAYRDDRQRFTLAFARGYHAVTMAHGALLIAVRMGYVAQAVADSALGGAKALRTSAGPTTCRTGTGPVHTSPLAHGTMPFLTANPDSKTQDPPDHGFVHPDRPMADSRAAAGGAYVHSAKALACFARERMVGDRAYKDFSSAVLAYCLWSMPWHLKGRPASRADSGDQPDFGHWSAHE